MKQKRTLAAFDMQFVTATLSTTLVLLLLGLAVFVWLAGRNLSVYVRENIGFTVMLGNDLKESEALKLQRRINREDFVKHTTYISPEEALEEQIEALGTDPREFLKYNPFSPLIEVKLQAAYAHPDSVARIEAWLMKQKGVEEVDYRKDLLQSVNSNLHYLSLLLLGLAVLLACISFALINNTIRLTIYSKRFLIHTMKLVGASWSFIRRPFLVRNFWIGCLSAVLADGALWLLSGWLVTYSEGLVVIVTLQVMLLVSAVVLIAGICITWLCALLSINRFLRMKADALYHI